MEWLETDGLGGFAMGTAVGVPMRRYHALLNSAVGSPSHRVTLVNAVEVHAVYNGERFPLSTFCFENDVWHPDGISYLKDFTCEPWPTWHFSFKDIDIQFEIFMAKENPAVFLSWTIAGNAIPQIEIRPFYTSRFFHALHKANDEINLNPENNPLGLKWQPYPSNPAFFSYSNCIFKANTLWFKNVEYSEDKKRGADHLEDLASPGFFESKQNQKSSYLIFSLESSPFSGSLEEHFEKTKKNELLRREKLGGTLERAADHYIVKRGQGKTIIAGYPWFADWGRDTFISIFGFCLHNNRLEEAKSILTEWSKTIDQGMLPNRFLDEGSEAEYNSVDASLWFISACYTFIKKENGPKKNSELVNAIKVIIDNFIKGTRYQIGLDPEDGLLRAGVPKMQLTWMDAKVGDQVFTPRIGKPVEIQALWLNALTIAGELTKEHGEILKLGLKSFESKFWNSEENCLFDVIDVDHIKGKNDPAIRPNQIFAVGGLPFQILTKDKAKSVVDCVEKHLLTPCGLRTLAPKDPAYRSRYLGDSYQRDSSYHQGTVWPWLLGSFVEAWVNVNGANKKAKITAIERFLKPILANLNIAGLGHLSEIHDADFPHISRGCPFQAWSVAEVLRLQKAVLSY